MTVPYIFQNAPGGSNIPLSELDDNFAYLDTRVTPVVSGGTGLASFTSGFLPYASSSTTLSFGSNIFSDGTNVGIGTNTPNDSGGNVNLSVKTNGNIAIIKASTTSVSLSGQARIEWATGTPNSYCHSCLNDNGGNPYWFFYVGPAVSAAYLDVPIHVWRSAVGSEYMRLNSTGLGIGTSSPTGLLDVNSDLFRVRVSKTPASASAAGNQGEFCWDSNYIYVCVGASQWKRAALSTW